MIARAMSAQPQLYAVEPFQLARQQGRWRGKLRLSAFKRLAQVLASAPAGAEAGSEEYEGVVTVDLHFYQDEQRRAHVTGQVVTQVYLSCQRCLQAVSRPLTAELDLCLVRDEARAQALDSELEPFVVDGDSVLVVDLIEDELILALPQQVCVDQQCPDMPAMDFPAGADAGAEEGDNPFAVLKHWRKSE
jgi:uncharacterized protein